jgi:hypothetical protein
MTFYDLRTTLRTKGSAFLQFYKKAVLFLEERKTAILQTYFKYPNSCHKPARHRFLPVQSLISNELSGTFYF